MVSNRFSGRINSRRIHDTIMAVCPFKYDSLPDRKSVTYPILYHEIFKWKMENAPHNINHFCNPCLEKGERDKLVKWIRNVDDNTSCQHLQILFAFSVPDAESLEKIVGLKRAIVSAGAGVGYWEYLLLKNGVDVIAFDNNTVFPQSMHYIEIKKETCNFLEKFSDRVLMLAWPDEYEDSTFSLECLNHYHGDTIIHIGELLGETLSHNPWGQTTGQKFQLQLAESFRCVYRHRLPNWPGHMDSFSIWCRLWTVIMGCFVIYLPG